MPATLTASEACVIRRSISGVLRQGSRYRFRKTGSKETTRAETRDLSARTASTFANGQERTKEVYWGRMTWMLMASPVIRKRIIMVKVGLLVRNMVNREMYDARQDPSRTRWKGSCFGFSVPD